MSYTIGQVANIFGLSVSTLRYYDAQGFFPHLRRTSGIRQFEETEIDTLRIVHCLKQSGLSIDEIRHFIDLCQDGPGTYGKRLEIFKDRARVLAAELREKERAFAMITFKLWYYQQASQQGNEDGLLDPHNMPEKIRHAYRLSQQDSVR